jgi:hypothetical protein
VKERVQNAIVTTLVMAAALLSIFVVLSKALAFG